MKVALFIVMAPIIALLIAACGGDDGMNMSGGSMGATAAAPGAIVVKLSNWAIAPAQSELKAGKVTFQAVHEMDHSAGMGTEGGATHELIVSAEDTPGSGNFSKALLKLQDIKPGESKTGSVDLVPGTYELSCQIGEVVQGKNVAHYSKGMHTTIKVQ